MTTGCLWVFPVQLSDISFLCVSSFCQIAGELKVVFRRSISGASDLATGSAGAYVGA